MSQTRASELFLRASELALEERTPFLERECAEQPDLRAEVESLLGEEGRTSPLVGTGGVLQNLALLHVEVTLSPESLPGFFTS